MLQITKVPCKFCHRPVTAVFRGYAWVAECEVCHEPYEVQGIPMPTEETKVNTEVPND